MRAISVRGTSRTFLSQSCSCPSAASQVKCALRELDPTATKFWDLPDLPAPISQTAHDETAAFFSRFYADEHDARLVAGKSTRCEKLKAMCNVDLPTHRHRVWSMEENMIAFYWHRFDDARRIKEALMDNWFVDLSKN